MLTVKELKSLATSLPLEKFRKQMGPFVLVQRPPGEELKGADPLGLPVNVAQTRMAKADEKSTLALLFEFDKLMVATLPPLHGKEELTVGRQPDCELVIDDASVSKQHAALSWDEAAKKCSVRDLGSTNGTCLNVSMMVRRETTLRDGDIISFGDVHFWFLLTETLHAKLTTNETSTKLRSYTG